ncbi:MAG: hypothetical protein ACM3ON_06775 [Chloroflexota bacterium]
MPLPVGKHIFTYNAVESPVVSIDPAQAKPISVGTVAALGDIFEIRIQTPTFAGPVNVTAMGFAVAIDPLDILFVDDKHELKKLSRELLDIDRVMRVRSSQDEDENEVEDEDETGVKGELEKGMNFKTQVTVVNDTVLGPLPIEEVPPGLYVLMLKVSTPGQPENFYLWVTTVTIP